MTTLRLEDIHVSYGKKKVIDGVSFSCEGGMLTALLGQNGSGKSTLIKALCGFIPYSGKVFVNDRDTYGMNERQRSGLISFIPQSTGLKDGFDLIDVVMMGYNNRHGLFSHPSCEERKRAEKIVGMMGLEGKLTSDFSILSGGEKQLALIARALVQDSPVMLMDEPDSSLDFNNRHRVLSLFSDIIHEKHYAGLIAIHSPDFALSYCDRLVILKDGKIVSDVIPAKADRNALENALSLIYDGIRVIESNGHYTVMRYEK